jgi:hypothetical protein
LLAGALMSCRDSSPKVSKRSILRVARVYSDNKKKGPVNDLGNSTCPTSSICSANSIVLIAPKDLKLDNVSIGAEFDLAKLVGDGKIATGHKSGWMSPHCSGMPAFLNPSTTSSTSRRYCALLENA